LEHGNRPTTPYARVGFQGTQAFLANETNEDNGMKAADGILAQVSTCEERKDRFGSMRRRALERATSVSAVQPSSDAPLQLLRRLVTRDSAFLEVAATDCSLSLSLAESVRRVYAVARSAVVTGTRRFPANFHLIAAEGNCIPVPQASVDLAYSNGLVDQLDPEQTCEQLASIQRAITRGGVLSSGPPGGWPGDAHPARSSNRHARDRMITPRPARVLFRRADRAVFAIRPPLHAPLR
jgi:hypothetical protein